MIKINLNADVIWRMALAGVGFGLFQTPTTAR
jgi:hypothetical protein